MRGRLKVVWLGFVTLSFACQQDDTPERFAVVEGGVCSSQSNTQCSGPDSILMCVDREWTAIDCAEVCAATGLVPATDGCVEDSCACETTPDSCAGMAVACISEELIEGCVDGEPGTFDCADVCANLDPPRSSLGCDAAGWSAECRCTLEGTSCEATAPARCDDAASLASCVDGGWLIESCGDGCGPDGLGYCSTSLIDDEVVASCACM
jgi:hypothetical protein